MIALLTLVACLKSGTCEKIDPGYAHADDLTPMSLGECLGIGGQSAALQWQQEHPEYVTVRPSCTVTNDPPRTRREEKDTPA